MVLFIWHLMFTVITVNLVSCRPSPDKTDRTAENETVYRPGNQIVFEQNSESSYPLITADPSKVCNDVSFYNSIGQIVQGTAECNETTAANNEQTADPISPENIKSGVMVNGVTGTLAECNSDGQVGCITTSSHPAVVKSELASKVLSGQTIAGISGSAVSADCSYQSQSNCESDLACSWTGSTCAIDPWNIRTGVTLSGIAGALKTNCRNRVNLSIFDYEGNSTAEWWDTIDDYNSNGAFPSSIINGWSENHDCTSDVWEDLTLDGSCDSATDDCIMKDKI